MLKMELIGNLTKDPETIGKLTVFDVAIGSKDSVKYIKCKSTGEQAENIKKYLSKGKKVFISGTPGVESYKNKKDEIVSVQTVFIGLIEFLSSKEEF